MDTTSKSYILLQFPSCRALARYRSISLENHDKANVKIPLVRQQTSALSFGTEIRGEYENQKKMKIEDTNSAKRQNIMIVDDEDDINLLFAMVLCGEGYNVDAFTDPVAAIMKFERGSYDLLIIDILLPKMDGFELYERIKQLDKNVKVCFLTAGDINYHQFKKAASFPEIITEDCFIKIPVENKTLVRKVKNILSFNLN
jgi:CheY-like chemotaxis protein